MTSYCTISIKLTGLWCMTHFTYLTFWQLPNFCMTPRKFRHSNWNFSFFGAVWPFWGPVWWLEGSTEARVMCDIYQSLWSTGGCMMHDYQFERNSTVLFRSEIYLQSRWEKVFCAFGSTITVMTLNSHTVPLPSHTLESWLSVAQVWQKKCSGYLLHDMITAGLCSIHTRFLHETQHFEPILVTFYLNLLYRLLLTLWLVKNLCTESAMWCRMY